MKLIPQARKVRFRLNINGHEVGSITDLRNHFSYRELLKLILSGQLFRWLEYLGEVTLSSEIRKMQGNGIDPLAVIKLFIEEYAECGNLSEVFFKEYHSKDKRPLLIELLSLIEPDNHTFLDNLIALNDKQLVSEWLNTHKTISIDSEQVIKIQNMGIKLSRFTDSSRWELPPSTYYPTDFSKNGTSFLSKIQSLDRQSNIPEWFKDGRTRRDMWTFMSMAVRLLNILRYGGSYRKDKVIAMRSQFLSVSNDNHFFTEMYFIGALIVKKYGDSDTDFITLSKERYLTPIKDTYIPGRILYDNWDLSKTSKVIFYPSVWYTDASILKSHEFLKLSLGEQICLLISNLFNSSLYE